MVCKRRSETKHHDEVESATTRKIYHLLSLVEDLLNSRGTPEYEDKLVKLPAQRSQVAAVGSDVHPDRGNSW